MDAVAWTLGLVVLLGILGVADIMFRGGDAAMVDKYPYGCPRTACDVQHTLSREVAGVFWLVVIQLCVTWSVLLTVNEVRKEQQQQQRL